jgi:hypothetical protein
VPAAPEVKGPGRPGKGEGRNLHYFRFGGKYGYVTQEGRMAIPPEYVLAENFAAQGVARAGDGKGTGLLDARGAWVVLPLLKDVTPEEGDGTDGYLAVNYSWHGRLGPDGRWTVAPRFQELKALGHGHYRYKFRGKFGIIAPDGKFSTGAVFEKLGDELSRLPDGSFLIPFTSQGKQGLVDQTGKVVISPRFESISPGFDGNGRYVMQIDGKYGVLDLSDRWILEPKYLFIEWKDKENRFWVQQGRLTTEYFYFDRDGKRMGPIPPADIWAVVGEKPFGLTGCFAAGGGELYGFCDREAKEQIKPQWDRVWDFNKESGLARVQKGGKFGFVDSKGKEVVPIQYDEAYDYDRRRRAVVMRAGGWGVLDETGKAVIEMGLEAFPAPAGEKGYFAKRGGKWGILDFDGRPVMPFEMDEALPYREATGLAWARRGGLWGMIDTDGKWALQPVYDDIGPHSEGGLAPAVLAGRFAVVDGKGAVVARSVVECGKEAVRDRAGKVSWPQGFACQG